MEKKLLIFLSIIGIGGILGVLLLFTLISPAGKDMVSIVLMAPLTGPDKAVGKAMKKGAELYIDQLNKKGGIRDREVNLLTYDDKSDKRTAMNAAYQVASENRAMLVIGHYYSTISIDAGKVYKKIGMPAIAAYATAEAVTTDNEWYFRIVPHNELQAGFIADYIHKSLEKTSASILFLNDEYGRSLAEGFERGCLKSGIRIVKKWGFDPGDNERIRQIIGELRAAEEPGMLFFAMYKTEAAKIIASVKYPDAGYSVIGPDMLDESFIEELRNYPQEDSDPGYYSDGIYATSPFLMDIANEKAYALRLEYLKRYGEEPSDIVARAYDAMHTAAEAIKMAEIEGTAKHIRSDRRKVRQTLAGFRSYDYGLSGVTGHIWFDANGDAVRPPVIGVYKNGSLVPSFSQYMLTDVKDTETDLLEKSLSGDMIELKGNMMKRLRVVYAGMSINEIKDMDIKNSSYTAEFYLWFRYKGEFDDTAVTFVNSSEPVKLGQPVKEKKKDGITIRTHRVAAEFKGNFDFHAYPFDRHTLFIRFQHADLTRDKLIFVADRLGMSDLEGEKVIGTAKLNAVSGWVAKKESFYQDIVSNVSDFGDPAFFDSQDRTSFSRFNAAIEIERADPVFILKIFLPILILMVILYAMHFIPPDRLGVRMITFMGVLLTNADCHLRFFADLPVEYISVIGYGFLTLYILVGVSVILSIGAYVLNRKGDLKKAKLPDWFPRIFYPLALAGGTLTITYAYIL
ncbi:ABC transporter substrate-binding protein [Desulfococcaceae bacterium HSG8]|nr:ABC transporter substrate-binding protein [Desulfococcaceae bacterium HSG8]